jgi:hypothetical protein
LAAASTVEAVVHSYTQAELALTEISGAVARFCAASEQLSEADAQNAEASKALRAATAASMEIVERLDGAVRALDDAAATLKDLDPDRLWAHLESEAAARRAEAAAHGAEMGRLRRVAILGVGGAMAAVLLLVLIGVGMVPIG